MFAIDRVPTCRSTAWDHPKRTLHRRGRTPPIAYCFLILPLSANSP